MSHPTPSTLTGRQRPSINHHAWWVVAGATLIGAESVLVGWQGALVAAVVVVSAFVVVGISFGELPGRRRLSVSSPLLLVVLVAYVAQTAHFLEHGIQYAYWLRHPERPPYLTPWAADGAAAASAAANGNGAIGLELLHLFGNAMFLIGLLALVIVINRAGLSLRSLPWIRTAVIIQGAHVAEHVALVTTLSLTGTATGVSTLFGALNPGPLAWGLRVLLHFAINGAATYAALNSLYEVRRFGLTSADSAGPAPVRSGQRSETGDRLVWEAATATREFASVRVRG